MLLFVVQPELEPSERRSVERVLDERTPHPLVDVVAIRVDLLEARTGEHPAPGALHARAHGLVVAVEQEVERRSNVGSKRSPPSTNASKNQLVCARCHLVGLASAIGWTIWSSADSGAHSVTVRARTSRNAASR